MNPPTVETSTHELHYFGSGDEFTFYINEGQHDAGPCHHDDGEHHGLAAGIMWPVTVDGTGNKIYVNGVEQSLAYSSGSSSSTQFFDDVAQLDFMGWGVDRYNGSNFVGQFDGFIDDGRVYDRALSASDVTELYNYTGTPNPQTYTVTNTNDSGAGSLRQAIIDANANLGADTIEFNIAGGGTQVINLSSALDQITEQVTIDGTTQAGWAAGSFLPIVLDGNSGAFDGLNFSATVDGSEVRGLVIRDFGDAAIEIWDDADNITIAGNWIGQFNSDGSDAGDGEQNWLGVRTRGANVVVGGSTDADRNVISGNDYGVIVRGTSSGAVVSGNYIGTNIVGDAVLGDSLYGVFMQDTATGSTIGGATSAHGNVIVGATVHSIMVTGESVDGNTFQHNFVGVSADGTTRLDFNTGNWQRDLCH